MPSPESQNRSEHLRPLGMHGLRTAVGCLVAIASGAVYLSGLEIATKMDAQQLWLQTALVPPTSYILCNLALEALYRIAILRSRQYRGPL